jgi:hypothetical protein
MELRQATAEHPVLDRRQHLIPEPLVERHVATQGVHAIDHPRPDHSVCAAVAESVDDLRQVLRRVLAVPV